MSLLFIPPLSAEEWNTKIQNKTFNNATKKLPGVIAEGKLDFGAFKSKLNGESVLVVRIRNGKHKMGGSTIKLGYAESPATLSFQRVDIAKPMSTILEQEDGAHLFDTFVGAGKTYQIFYHVKGGKLQPNVTISTPNDETSPDDK